MKRIKIKDHSFIRPAKSDYFFDYLPTPLPPPPPPPSAKLNNRSIT